MPAPSVRYGQPDPSEPVVHELPPLRVGGEDVPVRIAVRREPDGSWRGRLLFGGGDQVGPSTAEIFFGETEVDLWDAIRELREHHLRDLYRSLVE